MSCFVVGDRTINDILTGISTDEQYKDFYTRIIKERTGIDIKDIKGLEQLGKEMLKLNADAFNYRYEESETIEKESYEIALKYCFEYQSISIYQAYKSLSCFLYQCNEGNYDTKPIYLVLEDIKHCFASKIIDKIPEYQEAKWRGNCVK